ncbi:RiPP maturation radical SAM C-methyltransferase [Micromonospora sp. NBRC 101691]|uniref:RiPP maturation radical SAM C-methyltransferase n=1 Tax=Micromonospora sp. NBRC 101691 TaxID=3032198 RepID=UPI0024A421CE|nr:RiPP maturation radical SAM C-methyltransferase [Micromonospora sp. NBRC 101691]GLY24167.1 RiPP maturation radical SAM protein 1 [Micromonospora sp. NBRC 101691]
MRVCLVAMPWQSISSPSLPVGLLHSRLRQARPTDQIDEYHGYLHWAEHLLTASAGEITADDYIAVADKGLFHGTGDWVFAGALHDDAQWRLAEFRTHAESVDGAEIDLPKIEWMRQLAAPFVEDAAKRIVAGEPDVVGFTSTFMQTIPSLALARAIKRRRPQVRVVFGGANCDGPMGAALHRNHRFVDYVVRGEGELAFPLLLDRIDAGRTPADVPGVCWWDGDRSVAVAPARTTVPPTLIPIPTFDRWQADFDASVLRDRVNPSLVVEAARGCWWGDKHQCTFCGLNGSVIAFRSKPADQFWTELSTLVERHQILDVIPVDNILDMDYFRTLLPRLAAADWDLRMHYEVKSNLRADQVRQLAEAGIVHVQPGIESLSARVLKIMDKGVDGVTNVRLLRDSEDHRLTVQWNYLYGFPGETDHDYTEVVAQFPALVHLQPPRGAARITVERFSPYFERPELGFGRREPAPFYRYLYPFGHDELMDLAYFFQCDDRGIGAETARALDDAVARWQDDHHESYLLLDERSDGTLGIRDRRSGWPHRDHTLRGWHAAAYRDLNRPRTVTALHSQLTTAGHRVDTAELARWLDQQRADGLVFADADRWVALATTVAPLRIRTDEQAYAVLEAAP